MMGNDCNFAHSESELREQPDLVATKLCFQFSSKGQCSKGAACTFAHGKKELRQMPKDQTRRKEPEPMKVTVQKPAGEVRDVDFKLKVMQSLQTELDLLALNFAPMTQMTPFRPPPGLPAPPSTTCASKALLPVHAEDFESESSASTSFPFNPRMDPCEVSESEPCSPKGIRQFHF